MTKRTTFGQKGVAIRVAKKMGLKEGDYEIKLVGKGQWEIVRREETVATEPAPVADPGPTTTEPTTQTVTEEVPVRKLEIVDYADQPKPEATQAVETTPAPVEQPKPERVKQSSVASPVKVVWAVAEEMKAADPNVTRKAIMDACLAKGIAFYTARTQIQKWAHSKKTPAA